jgi:hypothetical protein
MRCAVILLDLTGPFGAAFRSPYVYDDVDEVDEVG